MKRALIVIVLGSALQLAMLSESACAESPATSQDQVRETIARSLQYLEKEGVAWIETKKCVTCHRVSFLTWSLSEASRKGFEVDRTKLQNWVDWSVMQSLKSPGEGKPVDGSLNLDGVGQLILAHSSHSPAPLQKEQAQAFVQLLLQGQQADGSWKPGGQLPGQKRPKQETAQVSTMWNALALGSVAETDANVSARRRALEWLDGAAPGKSTEWYAARLLLSHKQRNDVRANSMLEQLQSQQNADGGWGWLVGGTSDAIGTGLAVYSMSVAGVPSDHASIQRAKHFLVATQLKDGSWAVHGTKENKKGRVEETASYWGAAWATIGLLQTLR